MILKGFTRPMLGRDLLPRQGRSPRIGRAPRPLGRNHGGTSVFSMSGQAVAGLVEVFPLLRVALREAERASASAREHRALVRAVVGDAAPRERQVAALRPRCAVPFPERGSG